MPPCGGGFRASAQTASQFAVPGASTAWGRYRSDAVDIDCGQFVGCRLQDVAVVMDLHELAAVGRRAPGRRDGWLLKRFAKMREDLPDRPWLWCNTISRMSPPEFGHSRGNSSPTRAN